MMKIITLTLSPAFDVHCDAPAFAPFCESLVTVTSRDAGGKGVNISHALCESGVENTALVVLGRVNASEFRDALAREGIRTLEIEVEGRIRENFTLHTEGKPETRISFAGFPADGTLLSRVEAALAPLLEEGSIVTLTGRVPEGIPMEEIRAFLRRLRERGVRLVIDSKSFTLSDLTECRPWLIKPNGEEIAEYLRGDVETLSDAADAARKLYCAGIENVMISLGGAGAVLVGSDGAFCAVAPEIEVCSTVGAGDSAIAGFLAAAVRGASGAEALRTAVAYGSAACLTEGTQAPRAQDVRALFDEVRVQNA